MNKRKSNKRKFNNPELPSGCGRIFTLIWSGGFILIGLLFSILGLMQLDEAIASRSWLSTDGRVLSKSVAVSHSRDSDNRSQTTYKPIVSYQFTVEGKTYHGNRLRISAWGYQKRSAATAALEKLTSNDQCVVFYAPDNPDRSSLTAGFTWGDLVMPLLGTVSCLIGLVGGWFMTAEDRRARKRSKQKSGRSIGTSSHEVNQAELSASMPDPKIPSQFGPRGVTLQKNINRWGRENIGTGDDTLIDWYINSSMDDGDVSYVEVEPFPKAVGDYERFIFVVSFKKPNADLVATYCFEDGRFLLFSSIADAQGISLPEKLPDHFVPS
tara:strand:- start:2719 stop:3693 length:975 start_codon:yes stop_codon:yes gene_type:complete